MQQVGSGGHFTEVTLHPVVSIAHGRDRNKAVNLHVQANTDCLIASSVKFPIYHKPVVRFANELPDNPKC